MGLRGARYALSGDHARANGDADPQYTVCSACGSERTVLNLCALSTGASAIHAEITDAWVEHVATSPAQLAVMRQLARAATSPLPAQRVRALPRVG
jgi:hypothetical protein